MKAIKYVDFPAAYEQEREELLQAVDRVLSSGQYILGKEVERFEQQFAHICGTQFAISVANGTDALILTLKALGIGPGDEVITTPNSWISSASSIAHVGATPVFIDVQADQNLDPRLLAKVTTEKTKAILPVHLTGKCADMGPILAFAKRHNLLVIEDAAQAVGATYDNSPAGSMGDAGCFSLHPLKNLGCAGDGGVITTNSERLAEKLRLLRNHGLISRGKAALWGYNSRLDALQAAILNCRIPRLQEFTSKKRMLADCYRNKLQHLVTCPQDAPGSFDVYHLFVIQTDRRNELQAYLQERNIESAVHYPVPIHLQPCSRELGYQAGDFPVVEEQSQRILSLPLHASLTVEDVSYVADTIAAFFTA